jgi:hypothetical protein
VPQDLLDSACFSEDGHLSIFSPKLLAVKVNKHPNRSVVLVFEDQSFDD